MPAAARGTPFSSWSGSRPRQRGVSRGLTKTTCFPSRRKRNRGIWNYLDKGRRRPVLRVTRKQFPLAPGFATTAHAAQGQTCKEGVVMDMHIGGAGDPLTAYIALTRVQDRHGLFVYRPFPAAPFQKGAKVGRELLLRFWGGEKMDWSALRAKYRDERECKECNESKPASAFTAGRWKRQDAARVCKECIRRHVETQMPWQCMACTAWKQEDAFKAKHASPQATFYRICATCEQTQLCRVCNTRKDEMKFSAAMWKRARNGGRVCLACSEKAWGWSRCSICHVKQAAFAFCGSVDRAITPFAVMCGQKTIRFKRWMACNMAWPPAQRIHAIEQMAQGASCKKEGTSSCEVAPV